MYCSLGQNQFFDDAGAPLSAGRVKIYAKGSDTLLPIYEDNGDGFVPAQNPVITANDGRIPTVFWPAALVDVVVEKSNGDGTYTELDSYVAGLDLSSVDAVQGVSSIAELRSLMPSENMVVQVNGYYTAGDSPTRKYLWVAGAADTDDGGYVVASGVSPAGRWVMMWDDTEFLPASLYGIMCGYAGYSKTSNMMNFSGLGYYVLVGSVRVEVPTVLLFDWRMAQPTSGQSSPIAYHWTGIFETNHYVACARGVVFHTLVPPTIRCAGVRGESFTTAKWMLDLDYTTRDPKERISTLMFSGNTQEMHDAFMACVACAKVKFVELYEGGVYNTLTISDSFRGKVVIDYVSTNEAPPAYDPLLKSVLIEPKRNRLTADVLYALRCSATMLEAGGWSFPGSGNAVSMMKPTGSDYYPNAPLFPHGMYVRGAINASSEADDNKKMHVIVNALSNVTLDLTSDSATEPVFYNSKYKIGDMIVVTDTGSANIYVHIFAQGSISLSPNQSCWFIKIDSYKWSKVSA